MPRVKEDNDSHALALLGKKQVLKRRFGFWSLFGFAVCELITWETVLALFSQGFDNGGPAGLVYGFIIAWSSTLSVYTVISELASMAPIAGGRTFPRSRQDCVSLDIGIANTTSKMVYANANPQSTTGSTCSHHHDGRSSPATS